jgi:hypothetical protein
MPAASIVGPQSDTTVLETAASVFDPRPHFEQIAATLAVRDANVLPGSWLGGAPASQADARPIEDAVDSNQNK